jgi:uncharacterized protein YndB with AHSA1/START domain
MLAGLLVAAGVLVAGSLVAVASRPSAFRVARTATVDAPVPVVFAEVNDFHRWAAWSPYEKRDPAMRKSYEGAPAGTGAVYTWSGNKEVGEGRTTIVESRPNDLIRIRLEFEKPFKATSTAEFTFRPEGDRTAVTWSLTGRNSFPMKAVGLFMNMDRMIGRDFEQGLAQLKSVAEAASRA